MSVSGRFGRILFVLAAATLLPEGSPGKGLAEGLQLQRCCHVLFLCLAGISTSSESQAPESTEDSLQDQKDLGEVFEEALCFCKSRPLTDL